MHADLLRSATRPLELPFDAGRALVAEARRALRLCLVDTAIWTALTLAALTLGASHLLGLGFDLRAAGVIASSGLFIYNLDHLLDSYGEKGSAELWKRGIGRKALAILVLLSATALTVQLLDAPSAVGRVVVGYGLVGVLYGLPFFPALGRQGMRWYRLKDVPGMKAVIVASSITLATVGLPLAYAGSGAATGPVLAVALFVWTLVMCNTVMCDVGDLSADRRSGVRTLPVMLGVSRTRLVLGLLLTTLVGAFALSWVRGMVGVHLEVVTTIALVALYIGLVTERTPKQALSFLLDGCSFVPLIAAMALHGHLG